MWWRSHTAGDDLVLRAAAEQGFVLHMNELAGLGMSRQRARTLVGRRLWQAPRRGVVAPLAIDTPGTDGFLLARRAHALAATAEALVHRDHVVSAMSGAVLHGLPVVAQLGRPVLTSAIPDNLGRTGQVLVRGAELYAEDVTRWFGTPVTTVARTVIDMARLDRRDGIAAADAALREGLVSRAELTAALEIHRGWPGVRQARDVVALADPRAESPLESVLRLALLDDGFPVPELQVEIAGFEVDMLFRKQRLILEADGRLKYTGDALWREKRREQVLRRLDYQVERVIWADVLLNWQLTRIRLARLLGLHVRSG